MLTKISLFIDAIYSCVVKTEICRNVQYILVAFFCAVWNLFMGKNIYFSYEVFTAMTVLIAASWFRTLYQSTRWHSVI